MNMSAELLRNRIEHFRDERLTRLSENILRSGGQLLAFLKEFLANASTDNIFTPKLCVVNLVEIAGTVVQQYQETAQRKRLEIQTDFPAAAVNVLADASALDQALDNLLSNAVKFSSLDKKIFVSIRQAKGNRAECLVRDEGPGFSAEDKARMFRRYGRLSARPTGGEPSTGLGLSIVRKLVQAMNGELLCESNPGQGATFTICLPRPDSKK
jgi:two-component system sensor histidine kinase/response regulator